GPSDAIMQRSLRRYRALAGLAVAAAIGAAAIGARAVVRLMQQPVPQPVRFAIIPAASQAMALPGGYHNLAISPDGRHLAYRAGTAFGPTQLAVRDLDQLESRFVGESGMGVGGPFFSPDGQWIGFSNQFELKKVPRAGGPAVTLTRLT